jgi:hypothetical protein
MAVINPPERKLAKRTSVQCGSICGTRPKTMPLTTVLATIFLYFNLKQKTVSTNNGFHSEHDFCKCI